MKIKKGFVLREVAGSYVVMNLAGELRLGGLITLNETGAIIWRAIEQGKTEQEIVEDVVSEYEISSDIAERDVRAFIEKMTGADIIEQDSLA